MRKRVLFVTAVTAAFLLTMSLTALAAPPPPPPGPFLCPVVGHGVLNAPGHGPDSMNPVIEPPVGTSFLPGKNRAGQHANENAHNKYGPDNPNAGPGHNPHFSPIWPDPAP